MFGWGGCFLRIGAFMGVRESCVEVNRLRGRRNVGRKVPFSTVSLPLPVLEEIDDLIRKFGYWPSRSAFVREACLEKIRSEWKRMGGASAREGVKVNTGPERAAEVYFESSHRAE
jgi:Arc/MetJ-type ribon-helix-helix transcriptional regulator